jgi:ABC-type uncharacterized transport system permease subunit
MKLFGAVIALGGALLAVEMFYEHPTRGRGLKALFAVIAASAAL